MSNRLLQQRVKEVGELSSLPVFIPPRESRIEIFITSRLCTDNAIMIICIILSAPHCRE